MANRVSSVLRATHPDIFEPTRPFMMDSQAVTSIPDFAETCERTFKELK